MQKSQRRHVISVPGVKHGRQPFPLAVRVDQLVVSSAIPGMDPSTETIPTDPRRQIELVFRNMRAVVERAGGTVADIAQVLVSVSAQDHRDLVNEQWIEMFPDSDDRPARNTQVRELAGGMVCCVLMTAVLAVDSNDRPPD